MLSNRQLFQLHLGLPSVVDHPIEIVKAEGIYLEDRDFAHIGVTTGEKYNLGSSADEYTYFSLFGKANYVYNGKYLLSATVRRDGSSLFGEPLCYFPCFLRWLENQG